MTLLQGKHIFYIEDDLFNRSVITTFRKKHGAKVAFERWGRADELEQRLKAFVPVDLILCDLMLLLGRAGMRC